jgi:hypothetical protein
MNTRYNRNTVIAWQGVSRIDGKSPIALFVTGITQRAVKGSNAKTGPAIQTHILRTDVDPLEAIRNGADSAICGGCAFKGVDSVPIGKTYPKDRTCYVQVHKASLGIYRSFSNGNVRTLPVAEVANLISGRVLRLGSYGDPAAIPFNVWEALRRYTVFSLGYTHQYRSERLQDVTAFCQISADTEQDAIMAHAQGYGSFRVIGPDQRPLSFEMVCPSLEGVQCIDCGACSGGINGRNVVIPVHGALATRYAIPRQGRAFTLPVLR